MESEVALGTWYVRIFWIRLGLWDIAQNNVSCDEINVVVIRLAKYIIHYCRQGTLKKASPLSEKVFFPYFFGEKNGSKVEAELGKVFKRRREHHFLNYGRNFHMSDFLTDPILHLRKVSARRPAILIFYSDQSFGRLDSSITFHFHAITFALDVLRV